MKPQILIGALSSGSGKTTFTVGLLRALQRRGHDVQPFKCGPDYIDPMFHASAAGKESVNLDNWLSSDVAGLYARRGANADVCVTEGVMGLFDGYDRSRGSSAEVAQSLGIPVVLVVGSKSTAYTVAAQMHGMKTFMPGLNVAGVVFNQVASERHKMLLLQAAEDAGVQCFGCLPRVGNLEIPSRHLGLTIAKHAEMEEWISRAADIVEASADIDALLKASQTPFAEPDAGPAATKGGMRIAVASDEAFNFTYSENLASLEQMGQVTYFSPLNGDELPQADLLYLPGGYPELYAGQLAQNKQLMHQIADYAGRDGRILAECGGMIYLSKSLESDSGIKTEMCGVLPIETTMKGARLHLGYRAVKLAGGAEFRGHEFHYSDVSNPGVLPSIAEQTDVRGNKVETPLYRYKNVIAGYTHLYWADNGIMKLWG
ncbi:MAG: cobyrinate a,c-diamide synthase [Bacteroidales bacterium]|nr:cobyrinate a,c-diamide synthase [Bacteroidales bacterium]